MKPNRYNYLISVKPLKYHQHLYCKIPKETVKPHIRGCFSIYYDREQKCIKRIIYPNDLWFTYVDETDIVENKLIDIKNQWPLWYKIKIYNRDFNED